MDNRPLFGAGSARTLRQKQRPKFLRHNDVVDNRLSDTIAAQPAQAQAPCPQTPQQPVQTQMALAPAMVQAMPQAIPATAPVTAAPATTPVTPSRGDINDRQHTRVRTLKGGTIILPGQMMSAFNCKIRNESMSGAMLQVATAVALPNEFYLIRDSDPGRKVPCQVVWRGHDRTGVTFVSQLSCE